MSLNPHPSYPISGGYVLKLHRDARPQQGLLSGRLEHIASGDSGDFADAQGLLSWLAQHATRLAGAASSHANGLPTELPGTQPTGAAMAAEAMPHLPQSTQDHARSSVAGTHPTRRDP